MLTIYAQTPAFPMIHRLTRRRQKLWLNLLYVRRTGIWLHFSMGEVSVNLIMNRFIASDMERIFRRFEGIPDREKAMVASFVELTGNIDFKSVF